jgi:hypothetical protein
VLFSTDLFPAGTLTPGVCVIISRHGGTIPTRDVLRHPCIRGGHFSVLGLHVKSRDSSSSDLVQSAAMPINTVRSVVGAASNRVRKNDIVDPAFALTAMLPTSLHMAQYTPFLELQPPSPFVRNQHSRSGGSCASRGVSVRKLCCHRDRSKTCNPNYDLGTAQTKKSTSARNAIIHLSGHIECSIANERG